MKPEDSIYPHTNFKVGQWIMPVTLNVFANGEKHKSKNFLRPVYLTGRYDPLSNTEEDIQRWKAIGRNGEGFITDVYPRTRFWDFVLLSEEEARSMDAELVDMIKKTVEDKGPKKSIKRDGYTSLSLKEFVNLMLGDVDIK